MSFNHGRKLAAIAAGAAGLAAAGLVAAGPAGADQVQDDQYVAAVQHIFPGESLDRANVISNAHVTCSNLGKGSTFQAEVADLMKFNPAMTQAQAQAQTNAAISLYCPQYR